ncbi:MAG TPA: hypothetical protein VLL69_18250 [Streptosporangiaceae bacterium]|nr:hypothetical protein [Streptosporangiaceae bacterium]
MLAAGGLAGPVLAAGGLAGLVLAGLGPAGLVLAGGTASADAPGVQLAAACT